MRRFVYATSVMFAVFALGFFPNLSGEPGFRFTVPDTAKPHHFRGLKPGTYQAQSFAWYGLYFVVTFDAAGQPVDFTSQQ